AGGPGNAEHVLVLLGMKRRAPERPKDVRLAAGHIAMEQPVAETAAGLLLDDEGETIVAAKIDYGIGAPALDAGGLEHNELARLERHWARERDLELHHVVRELAHHLDAPSAVAGQDWTIRLGR